MSKIGISESKLFYGKSLSRGIGVGRVAFLHGREHQFFRRTLDQNEIVSEIERFRHAYLRAETSLRNIVEAANDESNSATSEIFASQLMMLTDSSLREKIEERILEKKWNAEWAVRSVVKGYIGKNRSLANDYFRERYLDLQDVSDRLISELIDNNVDLRVKPEPGTVFVAREISPATFLEVVRFSPAAIVTDEGGWTSHTSILAREFGIPAVSGISDPDSKFAESDILLVNAFEGSIMLNPSEDEVNVKLQGILNAKAIPDLHNLEPESELCTLDNVPIKLFVNLEEPHLYDIAKKNGANGVGLFRSENIIGRNKKYPSEAFQTEKYSELADRIARDKLTIRTFDIGVLSLNTPVSKPEKNPALGLRGIRYGLKNPEVLRTQIRALLQASCKSEIDILLPMVTDVEEISAVKKIVEGERENLANLGTPTGNTRLGVMIETPASVFGIDSLLDESDFVCVGTNDLVQYILVADRDNGAVDDWFRTLHPAFLTALKSVIDKATAKGKMAVVCGEMAGSPYYLPVLLGLGVTELSVNPTSLLRLRRVVASVSQAECREMASEMLRTSTPTASEKVLIRTINERWSHFMDVNPEILGNQRNF